jgi:hypothetical protein
VALADRRPEPRHRDRNRDQGRDHDRGRHRRDEKDDKPVVAFGDHTPAFLLRPVKISGGGD